jgi:hypothetical protein
MIASSSASGPTVVSVGDDHVHAEDGGHRRDRQRHGGDHGQPLRAMVIFVPVRVW